MTGTAGQDRFGVVESVAGGDRVAVGRIVAAHHHDMQRVCVFIMRDGSPADDAMQAAWQMPWDWLNLPGDTRTEWESGTGYMEGAGAYHGFCDHPDRPQQGRFFDAEVPVAAVVHRGMRRDIRTVPRGPCRIAHAGRTLAVPGGSAVCRVVGGR